MMGIIKEVDYPKGPNFLGNINWYKINNDAKITAMDSIESQLKSDLPRGVLISLFPKTDSEYFKSLLNDIRNGKLSLKTTELFETDVVSNLQNMANNKYVIDKVKSMGDKNISKIKSPVAKPIINSVIGKVIEKLGTDFILKGMINPLNLSKENADPIVYSNSIKILTQLGKLISTDSKLKDSFSSIFYSFLSKI